MHETGQKVCQVFWCRSNSALNTSFSRMEQNDSICASSLGVAGSILSCAMLDNEEQFNGPAGELSAVVTSYPDPGNHLYFPIQEGKVHGLLHIIRGAVISMIFCYDILDSTDHRTPLCMEIRRTQATISYQTQSIISKKQVILFSP